VDTLTGGGGDDTFAHDRLEFTGVTPQRMRAPTKANGVPQVSHKLIIEPTHYAALGTVDARTEELPWASGLRWSA
jgi:hypothetical protein